MLESSSREKVETGYKTQEPGKNPPESIYYPYLERPVLIVYPLVSAQPTERTKAEEQHNVVIGKDDYLVGLKVAIPGDPDEGARSRG